MWRLVVCIFLLFLGLLDSAFATDYELTVSDSSGVLQARTLTVYEQFGLIRPGDRIIKITAGALPVPNMACKIYVGEGSNSTVLTPNNTLRNFKGEIRLGNGNPGSGALAGALLMHVVPTPNDTRKSGAIIRNVGGFFQSHPWIWIVLGCGLVVVIGVAYFRMNSRPAGVVPVYGKRAYEENIREVKARLEQIIASQEELVKKPPVLRSFRKQIERFDHRLDRLESEAATSNQTQSSSAHQLAELKKNLDGVTAQEKSSRTAIDQLQTSVDGKSVEQRQATDAVRQEAKANAAKLEALASSLSAQLAEETQRSEQQAQELTGEISKLQGMLAEADKRIGELGTLVTQVDRSNAERNGQVSGQVKQLSEQFDSLVPSTAENLRDQISGQVRQLGDKVESLIPEASNQIGDQIKGLYADLSSAHQESLASTEELSQKLAELSHLPSGISSLQGELESLRAHVAEVSESAKAAAEQSSGLREDVVKSSAHELEHVVKLQGLITALEESVGRAHVEAGKSHDAALANGQALGALADRFESLKELPKSVAKIEGSVLQSVSKLAEAGLNKSDLDAILKAHQKLGSLPGELSQVLQKSVEQKVAGLVAQSIAAKDNGKSGGKAVSEEGNKMLSEVAKQLVQEIEYQKSLETAFADLRGRLEGVPDSIARLEQRLESPASSKSQGSPDEVEKLFAEIRDRLDGLPKAIEQIAARLEHVDLPVASAPAEGSAELGVMLADAKSALGRVPEKLEELDGQVRAASGHWEQASKRLDEALALLIDLSKRPAAAPITVESRALEPIRERMAPAPEAIKPEKPAASEPLPPTVVDSEREDSFAGANKEPAPAVAQENPVAVAKEASAEKPKAPAAAAVTEAAPEPVKLQVVPAGPALRVGSDPPSSLAHAVRNGEQEWSFAGQFAGSWHVSSVKALVPDDDPARAVRAMTPTETPGIEYEVGAMLYLKNRILYAHGDSIRAFWPGQSERSLLLSHAVPNDHWRLLAMKDTLFCAQENRVETVDLAGWARSAAFAGVFEGQCATNELWAGLRKAKVGSVLEFRDSMGELAGDVQALDSTFGDSPILASDGEAVYVAGEDGDIVRVTPSGVTQVRRAGKVKLASFMITNHGPLAALIDGDGVSIIRFDSEGKETAKVIAGASLVSGNMAILRDNLYFFDPENCALCACDYSKMEMLPAVDWPNVQMVRRMIALDAGPVQSLLIAGSDAAGKLGSVFLYDPNSSEHLTLCSTNQPHVDAIFADGCPVVLTSSSYQNIIRVFQPFVRAQAQAA